MMDDLSVCVCLCVVYVHVTQVNVSVESNVAFPPSLVCFNNFMQKTFVET